MFLEYCVIYSDVDILLRFGKTFVLYKNKLILISVVILFCHYYETELYFIIKLFKN